ncbi:MAG: homocysteine S-methyltransferase family protein [SAR202 cluster bacterium]|jgi:homocysteine S-methyltransferase|nr:homocysteine S-methyltransferase family protein [SAR202 cluster bacterium]MDP6663565.1 homocysteine S-methyltransferase family protein [SAR202 cluster bacterium]MDP6799859.1 homocysteine S-methyltransferase family protein [SAR202 cluster bacterium]MQG57174.1 homocysteine S-methyltransferase family protein [SAR202 cluster bacterium]MQG67624.1 homocysteine S-methyltransferase family protein [SAR202 cluster bacterium]|tara:strand:- start:1564 stop:2490 length:927 start_codon:yes stop_codon:yes gene_type:complete
MSYLEQMQSRIDRGEAVILDGATGTELQRRGVPMHGVCWSATALTSHPQVVRQIHEDYTRAGADIIITNTFSTDRPTLELAGMGDQARDLTARAVALAKEARDAAADRPVCIAGSMARHGEGLERAPTPDEAKAAYRELAHLLAEGGVDLIMLEMMRDVESAALAIEAAVSTGLLTWVGFSCRIDDGQVVLLDSRGESFAEALDSLLSLGANLVSVMHSEVAATNAALNVVRDRWTGPSGAYAQAGRMVMPNWQFEDAITPDEYLSIAQGWVESGVQVVGGCCGIGPEHIRALKDGLPAVARPRRAGA